MTTNRHDMSDTTSWFKIWEALTAVYSKCILNDSRGSLRGLGNPIYDRALMKVADGPNRQ